MHKMYEYVICDDSGSKEETSRSSIIVYIENKLLPIWMVTNWDINGNPQSSYQGKKLEIYSKYET